MSKIIRLQSGERFGRLMVISDDHGTMVRCICDCGADRLVRRTSLRYGSSRSCGCAAKEKIPHGWNKIHGMAGTPEYAAWVAMRGRCTNPMHQNYHNYGGRGITICERWSSFDNFMADMGPQPPKGELDRKNNMASYTPDNCRWTTRKKNQQNMRTSMRWFIHGKEFPSLHDAANSLGVSSSTVFGWCKGYRVAGIYYPPRDGCWAQPLYTDCTLS